MNVAFGVHKLLDRTKDQSTFT